MRASELKAEVAASSHAKHYFSRDTMRFFKSRLEFSDAGPMCSTDSSDGQRSYFVTSEQFDDSAPRRYTVRCFDRERGRVDTIGEFQAWATRAAARKAMYASVVQVAAGQAGRTAVAP